MKILKVVTLAVAVFSLSAMHEHDAQRSVTTARYHTLKSPLVAFADGKPKMLDWKALRDISTIRLFITEFLKGKEDKSTKQRVGLFIHNGATYTFCDFAKDEANNTIDKETLHISLNTCKKEFMAKVNPYMGKMNNAKDLVVELMKESCKIRNIPDSFLLTWTKTNGNENQVFNDGIQSFHELERFCNELYNFLGDLIQSCPKALAEFKKRVAEGTHLQ